MEEDTLREFLENEYSYRSDHSKYFVAISLTAAVNFFRCCLSSKQNVGVRSLSSNLSIKLH